jgi:hypothetical protein
MCRGGMLQEQPLDCFWFPGSWLAVIVAIMLWNAHSSRATGALLSVSCSQAADSATAVCMSC